MKRVTSPPRRGRRDGEDERGQRGGGTMKGVAEKKAVRQRTFGERDELMTTRRGGVGEERGCQIQMDGMEEEWKCEGKG